MKQTNEGSTLALEPRAESPEVSSPVLQKYLGPLILFKTAIDQYPMLNGLKKHYTEQDSLPGMVKAEFPCIPYPYDVNTLTETTPN